MCVMRFLAVALIVALGVVVRVHADEPKAEMPGPDQPATDGVAAPAVAPAGVPAAVAGSAPVANLPPPNGAAVNAVVPPEPVADPQVAGAFTTFCASWMEKLAAREVHNVQQIQWRENGVAVEGDYVGYSKEHKCDLKAPQDKKGVPIGKVSYRELLYRKRGGSKEEATAGSAEIVEITEVTEIFRYDKGKWIY
jgi:hypothetical protein